MAKVESWSRNGDKLTEHNLTDDEARRREDAVFNDSSNIAVVSVTPDSDA